MSIFARTTRVVQHTVIYLARIARVRPVFRVRLWRGEHVIKEKYLIKENDMKIISDSRIVPDLCRSPDSINK